MVPAGFEVVRPWRFTARLAPWLGLMCLGAVAWQGVSPTAHAETPPAAAGVPPSTPADGLPPDQSLDARRKELGDLQSKIDAADAERRKIVSDIESIRTDRARLNAALLDTTGHIHDTEAKAAAIEARLSTMQGSEDAIRQSLAARRDVLAEILAALQRLGRKPPPAILVSPDDILETIRSSMLLGAVLPEMRGQAEALASDLADLQRLRRQIATERENLAAELAGLTAERSRLDVLVAARQDAQSAAEQALGNEQGRAADLASKAGSLKDLIARMEGAVASAKRAGDAARAADEARSKLAQTDADAIKARVAAGPFRDPARLAPAVDFADTKSMLALPVTGRVVKNFGTADEFGGTEKGLSLATRPAAVVSTPADGWVAFSGPYRTYGQILIINAGGGYHIVLAGMKSVDVAPGQFVLAGEPVATMGDGTVRTAAAIALGATEPILYVEFRKDGAAVDPTPWWAKAGLEKVRG